jgi:hypothetical protein
LDPGSFLKEIEVIKYGHLEKSGFALSRHEHKKAAQRRLGKNPCATS